MQLLTNIDPRDDLQKATRWELIDFARANGIDVPHDAPAPLTMKLLRARNLTRIPIPDRPLGLYGGAEATTDIDLKTTDADEDLIRQYQAQKKEESFATMPMPELRSACKAKGIKMERRDNLQTLREKLAAHV